ncbi:hypothetical protein [Dickeya dianthicola]|uniref:Uncharacterized protein n=1 Tax=Dickeya dianthicola TaxID=204039 RepID=A0AAX1C0I0_9GAMM|nr:hypothetical protein [Dickeya dianthicola]MCI4003031.1 hypothetical protein [Dickeya dianthicola]MCI4031110.1 hypothetical protein [Dickeya dianthicola]MCI4172896.1 hypothetical protein [Dickeya dianthicola]MCI4177526.1 hypothetical protein [Dickeya dianthicola]MCI4182198.1 hypothetical protein [Dickeya dianthicola]
MAGSWAVGDSAAEAAATGAGDDGLGCGALDVDDCAGGAAGGVGWPAAVAGAPDWPDSGADRRILSNPADEALG